MPAANEISSRRHGTKRTESSRRSKAEEETPRRRHRTRVSEPDSDADYVYGREPRSTEKRTRFREVRAVGRHGDGDEAHADVREDHVRDEGRHRSSQPDRAREYHHRQRQDGRPREHRSRRPRTEEEERERNMRRERRARRAREEQYDRNSPPSSRTRHERTTESPPGFWARLLAARSKSVPPRAAHNRPQGRRNASEPLLSRSPPECEEPALAPKKRTSEKKKDKPTSFIASFFAPAVKEEVKVKLVSCVVCLDDDVKSTRAPKLKCGHRMCHSCLRRAFKLSLTDPQQMPPRCCTADQIPVHVGDTLFRKEWMKNWTKKYEEYTTKNRIYCPSKKCGEWIRPDDIKRVDGKKQGICSKCKVKVCATCNAKWHGARDCPKDAETNALLETAREAGWQRCYSCRTLVELKEGCNHMTCRCTAEFCMLCGLKWRTCECPWFNYETVEADRLAHMRVPADRPPPPPLFPRAARPNQGNPFEAFLPPPARPGQAPANPPIDVFAVFGQMVQEAGNEAQQARQRQQEQHRQNVRQQQQIEERQRQMRADEEIARTLQDLSIEEQATQDRRRRRQASASRSAPPRSVQAGLGGRRSGSDRVDMWMENVLDVQQPVRVR